MIQYEPIRCPSTLPVRTRSRRCEALTPVRAAASRNDNRSSAKEASERGYDWGECSVAARGTTGGGSDPAGRRVLADATWHSVGASMPRQTADSRAYDGVSSRACD